VKLRSGAIRWAPVIRCLAVLTAAGLSGGMATYAGDGDDPWQDVAYLDFRRAAPRFEAARQKVPPGSREWYTATLGLALCLHQRQPDMRADKDRAAGLYDELILATPKNEIQATALLLRGKLEQFVDFFGDEADPSAAAAYYARVLRDWPASICAHEAVLYLAQTAIFTMDKRQANAGIARLRAWIEAHPDNPFAATQWLLVSLAYRMPFEDVGTAAEVGLNALHAGLPKETKLDGLYWQIANMARQAGKRELARDFYARIIQEVQRSTYAYMARQRILDMGLDAPELIDPFAP
jgi:tetratricopeptide (TPR) repeat protein